MHHAQAPRRPVVRATLFVGLLLAAIPALAQAIGDDELAPVYTADSIDYGLGLTQMGIELCETLEEAAREAGVAPHEILPRAECEAQVQPSLRARFPAEQCEEGGLYLAPLETCLNAMKDIVSAKGNHPPHEHDAYVEEVDTRLSEACEPSKICRSHVLPL